MISMKLTVARMWVGMYKACVEYLLSKSIHQLPVHIFKVQTSSLDAFHITHFKAMDVFSSQHPL